MSSSSKREERSKRIRILVLGAIFAFVTLAILITLNNFGVFSSSSTSTSSSAEKINPADKQMPPLSLPDAYQLAHSQLKNEFTPLHLQILQKSSDQLLPQTDFIPFQRSLLNTENRSVWVEIILAKINSEADWLLAKFWLPILFLCRLDCDFSLALQDFLLLPHNTNDIPDVVVVEEESSCHRSCHLFLNRVLQVLMRLYPERRENYQQLGQNLKLINN